MLKAGFVVLLVLLVHLFDDSSAQKDNPKDICSLPIDVGPCKAHQPRWAYDSAVGTCVQFIYGGCKGNANNFPTQEACLARCSGV
nr:trypsin inhibitor-like [Leptinotarsa decemlineata]